MGINKKVHGFFRKTYMYVALLKYFGFLRLQYFFGCWQVVGDRSHWWPIKPLEKWQEVGCHSRNVGRSGGGGGMLIVGNNLSPPSPFVRVRWSAKIWGGGRATPLPPGFQHPCIDKQISDMVVGSYFSMKYGCWNLQRRLICFCLPSGTNQQIRSE